MGNYKLVLSKNNQLNFFWTFLRLAVVTKYFVDLKSNFFLFPRLSHNFYKEILLKQTPHIKN